MPQWVSRTFFGTPNLIRVGLMVRGACLQGFPGFFINLIQWKNP